MGVFLHAFFALVAACACAVTSGFVSPQGAAVWAPHRAAPSTIVMLQPDQMRARKPAKGLMSNPPDLAARRAAVEANKGKPIELNVDPSAYTGIGLVVGFVAVAYGYKVTYLGE